MAQLGTIKLQTDSGIVDVPVFDVGDSGGSTVEALRVQTDSGIGFVPLVDPVDAASPQEAIRVQTDSGIKAVTDSASLIPDSAIHRFKLDEGSGTTATDSIGNNDLSLLNGSTYFANNSLIGDFGLNFDGNNDEAVGNHVPGLSGNSAFSVAFTLDTDQTAVDATSPEQIIQNMGGSNRENALGCSFGNESTFFGQLEIEVRDSGGNVTNREFRDITNNDGFKRIVYTHGSNNSAEIFVDSVAGIDNTGGAGGNTTSASSSFTLGSTNGQEFGDVALDDVILFSEKLSQNQVDNDFTRQQYS